MKVYFNLYSHSHLKYYIAKKKKSITPNQIEYFFIYFFFDISISLVYSRYILWKNILDLFDKYQYTWKEQIQSFITYKKSIRIEYQKNVPLIIFPWDTDEKKVSGVSLNFILTDWKLYVIYLLMDFWNSRFYFLLCDKLIWHY